MRDTMTIDNAIGGGILWFITVHVYPDCTRSRQIQNPIPPADLLHISARTDAMRWFAAESRLKTLSPWALVRTAGSTILSVFQISWNPSTRADKVIFIFLTRWMDWHTGKGTHGRVKHDVPVSQCERIADVYSEILREESLGNIVIHRYAEIDPAEQKEHANYIRDHLTDEGDEMAKFYRTHFSALWDWQLSPQNARRSYLCTYNLSISN